MKQMLNGQSKLDLNIWSHVTSLVILLLVGLLLVVAYCVIRIRYLPVLKALHNPNNHQQHQASVIERPFFVLLKDNNNINQGGNEENRRGERFYQEP